MASGQLSIEERLYPRLVAEDHGYSSLCLVWTGGTNGRGYGKIYYEGRLQPVHVVAYKLEVGPISEGKELDHLCFVKLCANVGHLEPVEPLVNKQRAGVQQMKTHCKRGHLLKKPNLYFTQGKPKYRQCRACSQMRYQNPTLYRELLRPRAKAQLSLV